MLLLGSSHEFFRKLFDDGHYAEATFAALKYLDQTVQRASKLSKSGAIVIWACRWNAT